ncbi:MAG: hypothetical protein VB071_10885, partial [Lawsonibacter sp.]|nr:hypothetical protein [Lawsonibacter sp.]
GKKEQEASAMKRFLALALSTALIAAMALPVRAAGAITGYALYTDIVAKIDGYPIASYNVGGHTAVMVKDLVQYGFYVFWNEEARVGYVWPESMQPGYPWEKSEPDYVPQMPEGKVGDPAYPIYASDIQTYVAGVEKKSFNIGGQTLIFLSDLTVYGDLSWNGEKRLAELTLAQDPVELALDRKEAELKEAGLSYSFDRYPGPLGTLAVYGQDGTSHGTSCQMLYVDQSGKQTDLVELLPTYGFGSAFYLAPKDIQFDEPGDRLTFVTPIMEETDPATGGYQDWGDTLCTFNTLTGKMESMQPLSAPLKQWFCNLGPDDADGFGQQLEVSFTRSGFTVIGQVTDYPGENIYVSTGTNSVCIEHLAASMWDEEYQKTSYSKAYAALQALSLPRVSQENFSPVNSAEQRAQAARYFRVTLNGTPISGNLWWGQGNNHVDLNFSFDEPIHLKEGDTLVVSVGLPT